MPRLIYYLGPKNVNLHVSLKFTCKYLTRYELFGIGGRCNGEIICCIDMYVSALQRQCSMSNWWVLLPCRMNLI